MKVVKGLPAEYGAYSRTVILDSDPYALAYWKDIIAVGLRSWNIVILDKVTGSQIANLSEHTDMVRSLAFSSGGISLVSGSNDKTVKLWDMQTGGVIKTFHGHNSVVLSVSISVDCAIIASGSLDKTIYLWDVQMNKCLHIIEQQGCVDYVSLSHINPQHLISVSDKRVWWWNIDGHQISPPLNGSCIAFSSDGILFVLCQGRAVIVYCSNSGAIVAEFHIGNDDANCCCFSPDDRLIAVAAGSTVYIWDIAASDPHIVETFIGHTRNISSLVFSSPSSLVLLSSDQSIKIWQISTSSTNPPITNLTTPSPIISITLKANDGIVISSDLDGVVKTWDISTGLCKTSFQTPAKAYHKRDVQLIGDSLIFVWQPDKKLYILDVEKEEVLQMVDGPQGYIWDIRISGDGSRVFCLYKSIQTFIIQAWSILTGEVEGKIEFESDGFPGLFTVDGSRVWVQSISLKTQGWDFGSAGLSPVQLSDMPSLHPNGTDLWVTYPSLRDTVTRKVVIQLAGIKDTATGKVVIYLAGRFTIPCDVQWDGQYLAAGYKSGEILILDFNQTLPH